ncbi:pyroglutamyl-peptidase I [Erwinia sorbitola]|uniref:Pyrrolidone-carboxylate peptidase n=1 Tax=Erwinia sorbitola TaxID=2681984 RepID=A0A6I6EET4_9GAMM|nr:pyroglutamyl-peptidase I [Erwinia sorbitola]MTD26813.1 pyroglutamyl-peptidase I [Erwinia sorbitola]QGU88384.1 pyroglutamyl-peptidase I [Erwinia sorbitola]
MKTVLITGFEPFEGARINPSWEAARQLNERMIGGVKVVARQLPCVFGTSLEVLEQAIDELDPVLVIAVALAGGRTDISVERVAINIDDARIADNAGNQPIDKPIIAAGPAAYFSTLPIKAIISAIREAGIPASVSQTAGTFVCNHVMYGLLHRLRRRKARAGLIHIPCSPEQAIERPGTPSMSQASVVLALEMAISIALTVEKDICLEGGATH